MTENSATYDGYVTKLYSPEQVAFGVFLGGPVGLIYFLRANFRALGNDAAASKTVIYGLLALSGGLAVALILPDNFPGVVFSIIYIFAARTVAEKHQKTKKAIADSPEYGFQSSWKVFGLALLCLVGTVLGLFALVLGLPFLFG